MSFSSKWALDGIFLIIHVKVMPWSISVDFFSYPNKETFASWWFLSQTLRNMIKHWSNDVCGFKIICWPKIWTFDCQMTIVDFLPNTIDFQSYEPLTKQNCDARLGTWHEYCLMPIENHGNHLRPLKPLLPCARWNPSYGPIA